MPKIQFKFKNSIFRQNMSDTKKTFRWKIICLNEVCKFSLRHFLTGRLFYVLILNIGKIPIFPPKYVRNEISVVVQSRFLK